MQDGSGVAALRGSNGSSDRFGQVLAIDDDAYFWKGSFNLGAAVDLVEGTSAANGGERSITPYDTSANYAGHRYGCR